MSEMLKIDIVKDADLISLISYIFLIYFIIKMFYEKPLHEIMRKNMED